jgi:hypothetical protein
MVLNRNRCGNTAKILHFVQNDKPVVILSFFPQDSSSAKDLDGTESESLWRHACCQPEL